MLKCLLPNIYTTHCPDEVNGTREAIRDVATAPKIARAVTADSHPLGSHPVSYREIL